MIVIRCADLETTGEPSETVKPGICEIGWCDVEVERDPPSAHISQPVARITNPRRPIPPEAMAVHHITEAMVQSAVAVDRAVLEMMETKPDFFCAHVAEFEQWFIGANLPWLCTYKISLRFWPEAPNHKLQTLRYFLGLEADEALAHPPHRAGPDAYVCALLIARILREAEGKTDLDTLVKWSSGPALLPRFTFGKHKGLKWSEAPPDYLEWILFKSDMGRDEKANARYHLKLKGIIK